MAATPTEMLGQLAKNSPLGFIWLKDFVENGKGAPLDDFLKSRKIPYGEYVAEVTKGRLSAGELLQAARQEPQALAKVAEQSAVKEAVRLARHESMAAAEKAANRNLVHDASSLMLKDLAEKSPLGFVMLKEYTEQGGKNLQAFLRGRMTDTQYVQELYKSGHSPQDLMRAIEKRPEVLGQLAERGAVKELLQASRQTAAGAAEKGLVRDVVHDAMEIVRATKAGKLVLGGGLLFAALAANAETAGPETPPRTRVEAAKDFAAAALGLADPTALLGPSLLENAAAHALGRQSEMDRMGIDTRTIAMQPGLMRDFQWNTRLDREQKFILGADHPGQLGALKLKDGQGHDAAIGELLKDKSGRQKVFEEIEQRQARAATPEARQMFTEMHAAARDFTALEDRRRAIDPNLSGSQKLDAARAQLSESYRRPG